MQWIIFDNLSFILLFLRSGISTVGVYSPLHIFLGTTCKEFVLGIPKLQSMDTLKI